MNPHLQGTTTSTTDGGPGVAQNTSQLGGNSSGSGGPTRSNGKT